MQHSLDPLTWSAFWTTWTWSPIWLLTCAVLLAAYAVGLAGARRRHVRAVHPVRVACFVAGVLLLAWATSSAVDAYAMSVFWMHMVQHLTLITVVPALLVLGHPLTVLREARGGDWPAAVERALRSPVPALLTHPLVGFLLYSAVIVYTHLGPFMDQMATSPALMGLEQVLYVVTGYLALLPVVGDEPIRWDPPYLPRIGLLLAAMVPDTIVGIVLLQTERVPYPAMMAMHPSWAPDPLRDTEISGGLMWVGGDGLMMCLAVGLVVVLVSGHKQDKTIGSWLESVRTNTLAAHVEKAGGTTGVRESAHATVDDDDEALADYNAMLQRLHGQGR